MHSHSHSAIAAEPSAKVAKGRSKHGVKLGCIIGLRDSAAQVRRTGADTCFGNQYFCAPDQRLRKIYHPSAFARRLERAAAHKSMMRSCVLDPSAETGYTITVIRPVPNLPRSLHLLLQREADLAEVPYRLAASLGRLVLIWGCAT